MAVYIVRFKLYITRLKQASNFRPILGDALTDIV